MIPTPYMTIFDAIRLPRSS